jgi:hypothetical protein
MGWTVAELEERMSAYELQEKRLLEEIEPWGPRRADYRAAVIACTIACCHSAKGSRPKFRDFMKMFEFTRQQQSEEQEDGFFEQFK